MRSRYRKPTLTLFAPDQIGQPDQVQGLEISGQQCLIIAVDGDLEPPVPPRYVDCPPGYRIAGGFRLGNRSFALLHLKRNDLDGGVSNGETSLTDLLTERELQIVMLVARGKVNKQIAYQLRISEYTVSTHLRRIFCKLGVSSRAAMVAQLLPYIPRAVAVPARADKTNVAAIHEP